MKSNDEYLKELLMYLINQTSYESLNEVRHENQEIPKLLESFVIRFFMFYLLLNSEIRLLNSNGELLSVEINSKFLSDYLGLIKKKTKIVNKFNAFGISFLEENSIMIKRNIIQNIGSEKVYTVKEEFFQNQTEIPNILDYLTSNSTEVKVNDFEKFSNKTNFNLSIHQCLQIFQQLDQSILGGVLIQTLEMNDFNYVMNNLNFKEKIIRINIVI
jgi:hypothetical protein